MDQKNRHDTRHMGILPNQRPETTTVYQGELNRKLTANFKAITHFRRSAVFRTIFTLAILLWMVGLAASFGPGVMPLLLVLGTILTAMNFAFRRISSN